MAMRAKAKGEWWSGEWLEERKVLWEGNTSPNQDFYILVQYKGPRRQNSLLLQVANDLLKPQGLVCTQYVAFFSISLPLVINKQACHPFCHGHLSANKRSHPKVKPALWRQHWENQGYPLQYLGCVLTADKYRLRSNSFSALHATQGCVCPAEI